MNLHKVLANIVVFVGFLLVPFIPFIVLGNDTFFPFIVGKNFAFRIVVEIMLSAWVVLAAIDPAYRPKKGYIFWSFVALLGIITLSAIFGQNPAKSFWSNFERMEGVITYLHLFAYFIVASTVLTAQNLWKKYFNLHLAAGAIMAIYGVLQWAGDLTIVQDGARVNGTLGNAAYLGTYAFLNVFIAAWMASRENFSTTAGRVRVGIYSAIIILQTFVLYHTATRGAVLGLIVGVGITALLVAIFERQQKIIQRSAMGVLIAAVLFVGGFMAVRNAEFVRQSPVLSRFAAISFTEQTTKSRLMVWDMAFQGFKEHPVLGWGMEGFNYVFNKYYNPAMYDQEQWFDRAHNVFFDWLTSAGALGLLAYLSLFASLLYLIWRRGGERSVLEKSVLTGLIGGYLFQNLFVFDNLTSLIYFATILAYVEGTSYHEEKSAAKGNVKSAGYRVADENMFMVSIGALILAVVLVYTVNYNGFMQNITLIRAMSERSTEGPMHNLGLFKEALAYDSFGTAEVREQLGQLSMNGFDSSRGLSDAQKQFIILATEELKKQAAELPRDARYQVFAGSFLLRVAGPNEALPYIQKALELSPKKQSMLFLLGSAYYGQKEFAKAEDAFKRAYELAPQYNDAEKFYLQILVANNKKALAEQILKDHPLPTGK